MRVYLFHIFVTVSYIDIFMGLLCAHLIKMSNILFVSFFFFLNKNKNIFFDFFQ